MPIRTALIGFGIAGRVFHAPLVEAAAEFELTAVVTSSPERAHQVRETYPGARILADLDAVLAEADAFDLAVVASPNATHVDCARQLVAAGLHVVVDKPIAVHSAEARDVVEVGRSAGLVVSVFHNRRWDGDFLTLRALLDGDELGDVHQFDSAFEWWKPQLGAGWKDTTAPAAGGGILYDLGPHLIDQALVLFGPVASVHAELDSRRPGARSDDDAFVTLHHESGVRSRLWMSAVAPALRPRFRVVGSRAVVEFHGLDPQERQLMRGLRPGDDGYGAHDDARGARLMWPGGERHLELVAGGYSAYYEKLAQSILAGSPVPVEPADGVDGVEIIERALGRKP